MTKKGDLSVDDYTIDDVATHSVDHQTSHAPASASVDPPVGTTAETAAPTIDVPPSEVQEGNDDGDDDDFDVTFLDVLNQALSDTIIARDTRSASEARSVKDTNVTAAEVLKSPTPTSSVPPTAVLPVDQLSNILGLLNHPFELLVTDDDLQQRLLEAAASLSLASLPNQHRHLVSSFQNFISHSFDSIIAVRKASEQKQQKSNVVNSISDNIATVESQKNKLVDSLQQVASRESELTDEIQSLQARMDDLVAKKSKLTKVSLEGQQHVEKFNKKLGGLAKKKEDAEKEFEKAKAAFEDAELSKEAVIQQQQDLKLKLRSLLP